VLLASVTRFGELLLLGQNIVNKPQRLPTCFHYFSFLIFIANQVQISCLISWSSELNGCGFLLLCQEQNITSKNRSDVGCTGTPFGISQFNPLRVLCYWVMKSFVIHLRFYSCGAPSTGWWLSAKFSRLTIKISQSPESWFHSYFIQLQPYTLPGFDLTTRKFHSPCTGGTEHRRSHPPQDQKTLVRIPPGF
jgi:hypothetical protein